jgi:hypothetical protein
MDVCESIALVNFFLLLCAYTSPGRDDRSAPFEALELDPKGRASPPNATQPASKACVPVRV